MFARDVGVIGGAGHVGLPLSLIFADSGLKTLIYDIDPRSVEMIRQARMPFREDGAQEILDKVLAGGLLEASTDPAGIEQCRMLVLIVGTPLDEHLTPRFKAVVDAIDSCRHCLRDGQTLILRSTVFPGMSRYVQDYLHTNGLKIDVAFCPERVAQGRSIEEFRTLPQIISAFQPGALATVRELFGRFTSDFIELEPMEAELAKLMTNAWRYIEFAAANQFYMIASEQGLDFDRILHACRHRYPRMSAMPGPGFAAGPCLVKDTMQLAAFSHNNFPLGHSALQVNEGLPYHLVKLASRQVDLSGRTAAILGMAFKAGSDDPRDSLSYKLKKLLTLQCRSVLCTDPFVADDRLVPLEQALEADVIFVGTPHECYRTVAVGPSKVVIDVWNCLPAPVAQSQPAGVR